MPPHRKEYIAGFSAADCYFDEGNGFAWPVSSCDPGCRRVEVYVCRSSGEKLTVVRKLEVTCGVCGFFCSAWR